MAPKGDKAESITKEDLDKAFSKLADDMKKMIKPTTKNNDEKKSNNDDFQNRIRRLEEAVIKLSTENTELKKKVEELIGLEFPLPRKLKQNLSFSAASRKN